MYIPVTSNSSMLTCRSSQVIELPGEEGVGRARTVVAVG